MRLSLSVALRVGSAHAGLLARDWRLLHGASAIERDSLSWQTIVYYIVPVLYVYSCTFSDQYIWNT